MTLHAQASSSFTIGIPSLTSPLGSSRHRFVIRAKVEPSDKSVEIMRKFSEQYARKSGTYFCVDKGVTSVVIKAAMPNVEIGDWPTTKIHWVHHFALADHNPYMHPICIRHYDDKAAEVGQGFWNCPCVPMRERKECHCMLFLTPDNDFAGKEQTISLEEIRESTANM